MTSIGPKLNELGKGFQDKGNNIFFHPGDASSSLLSSDNGPSLIVLCTWLGGASTRRVAKYTTGYRRQFPGSPILLIRTVILDFTVRSFATVRSNLAPARAVVREVLGEAYHRHYQTDGEGVGVLLHIFSNGGANMAIQLAISLQQEETPVVSGNANKESSKLWTGQKLPLKQIIHDCSPGSASFRKFYDAAVLSVPQSFSSHPILHAASQAAVVLPTIMTVVTLQTTGAMKSVDDLRSDLLDGNLFDENATRLYMYSKEDTMVDVQDVETHAEEARRRFEGQGKKGRVRMEMFEWAKHCSLVMEDEPRYWGLIREVWDEDSGTGRGGRMERLGDLDGGSAANRGLSYSGVEREIVGLGGSDDGIVEVREGESSPGIPKSKL
ncbi:hypothetical protein B0H66DRAFT_560690 [Apodospora peruviana]|uniref:DUF829-domain-containing protein n=1 Tax=Apodospora peruviana TaxID=516989 RepID=A0AAE0I0B4_9PEZI|nr:hypothetical protein B0H66DRAFT_560690 [Apodospora peruviana]